MAGKKEETSKVELHGAAKSPAPGRVRYPIGIKLVIIIVFLLLISLGSITVLGSVMVSRDLRITAEDNNFTINQRSAAQAENTLQTIRSDALLLLDSINAVRAGVGPGSTELWSELSRQIADIYFERNPDIAALAMGERMLINDGFFVSNEIETALVDEFMDSSIQDVEHARMGETVLLNTAPVFGIPVLAMLLPYQGSGGRETETVTIIFSSESLSDAFGGFVNVSFMVNDAADILIHGDHRLVMAGANMINDPLVRMLRESREQNFQTLYTDLAGNRQFGAFRKLAIANAVVITTVESRVIFEGISATTRRNIFLTGAVLFISILFIWFYSKTISRPLERLTIAAREIEEGQFEVPLAEKRRDEIGLLSESFVKMSNALGIFGHFTNREIAVRAMRGEIRPGGEPKYATIFFSDIRSFTAISENFTNTFGNEASDKIVAWLNAYLTRMVECVEKTNGVVDKYIGDSVMAHWGTAYTTGVTEHDALNAVRAALLMRVALLEMNRRRQPDDPADPVIRIGCGINSGIVTVGQIGSPQRMEYTVIGDAVNLASRTEAVNKPLGTDILITEDTWNLVGKYLITEEMPVVTVKGRGKPVRMFAVVNLIVKEGMEQPHPRTLTELRNMLGICEPDLCSVDVNAKVLKYKIKKDGHC
ncbi:adenylate/guanylate cyclase domain-containing protein [Treponema primitia]|uniref:adenylate/guanylate cyclase domain-containing protein n=1 Tax=Treponema primitia TaxID=88058 RepID=UPI0002555175|nr:adenylate/guanylate cyclase domain-containing protein [Treponema primitia]